MEIILVIGWVVGSGLTAYWGFDNQQAEIGWVGVVSAAIVVGLAVYGQIVRLRNAHVETEERRA